MRNHVLRPIRRRVIATGSADGSRRRAAHLPVQARLLTVEAEGPVLVPSDTGGDSAAHPVGGHPAGDGLTESFVARLR